MSTNRQTNLVPRGARPLLVCAFIALLRAHSFRTTAYPTFRKRYLQPERAENQVVSARYIWEIIKPGIFITRWQNPIYFSEEEKKKESPRK